MFFLHSPCLSLFLSMLVPWRGSLPSANHCLSTLLHSEFLIMRHFFEISRIWHVHVNFARTSSRSAYVGFLFNLSRFSVSLLLSFVFNGCWMLMLFLTLWKIDEIVTADMQVFGSNSLSFCYMEFFL